MPTTPSELVIDPDDKSVTVSVTGMTFYTAQHGSSAVTFPQTINSRTSYWGAATGDVVVSVKAGGIEVATESNSTKRVPLSSGGPAVVKPFWSGAVEESVVGSVLATTGAAQPYYSASAPSGVNLEVVLGSQGSPVTTAGPNIRVSRAEDIDASGNNLANEKNAAIVALSSSQGTGSAGDKMQANAIFAYAVARGSGNWDAVAINAVGKSTSSATRRGTGGYFEGLKDTSAMILGAEVRSNNQQASSTATDDDYNTSGLSNTAGLWVACSSHASANQVHGAGIQVGRSGTAQWGVGLGFVSGSIVDQTIRDDSSSTTTLLVQGTHTYGVDMQGATISGAAMRVPNAVSLKWRNGAGTGDLDAITVNASDELAFGVSASQITLIRFHRSLALNDNANIALGTSTGTKIGTSTTQKLGFYNSTPIVKPTVTGAKGSNAALGSLMTALANLGLVVDSTSA